MRITPERRESLRCVGDAAVGDEPTRRFREAREEDGRRQQEVRYGAQHGHQPPAAQHALRCISGDPLPEPVDCTIASNLSESAHKNREQRTEK